MPSELETPEPDMPREIRRDIHDHEILLSFVNDSDARAFYEWWQQTGCAEYRGWADRHREEFE